jgi:hypothetical protein
MLRQHWRTLLAAFIVVVALAYSVFSADGFRYCVDHQGEYPTNQTTNYQSSSGLISGGLKVNMICLGAFANAYGVAITALATLLLTFVTGGLVFLGWRQLTTIRTQLRAYVFPTGLVSNWELDQASQTYNWRFRVNWTNSGDTATQHLRTEVGGEVRNTVLPRGFNFRITNGNDVTGVIPPKAVMQSGVAPPTQAPMVTAQDISDCQQGRRYVYLYGWMRYRDVFPGSHEHITRFCWLVVSTGDPFTFVPNDPKHPLTFSYVTHPEGNCSDDECSVAGLG